MLEEIRIENVLLIERVRIQLHPGLNVISGETGVGKSLLLGAVSVLFGAKLEGAVEGATARVEGRFRLRPEDRDLMPEHLAGDDAHELVIRVLKKAGGAQRSYVNGSLVSRQELAALSQGLVDVHGQRAMQRLLTVREQVAVLDRYAGSTDLAAGFAERRVAVERERRRLAERHELEAKLRDRLDLLRFQRAELAAAELQPGEHGELSNRHRILQRARDAVAALSEGATLLEDDGGAFDRLARAGSLLERLACGDDELSEIAERAFRLSEETGDLVRSMESLASRRASLDEDPEVIAQRLHVLNDLMRKYHADEAGLLARLASWDSELEGLESEASGLADLETTVAAAERELLDIGDRLTAKRARVGKKLEKLLQEELAELRMPHARFRIDPGDRSTVANVAIGPLGLGHPQFRVRTNPGGDYAALAEAASGGELSRILLALKSILAEAHRMPLLVFDEIETGVGPRLGLVLGRRLARLAGCRQVLCITHLPQIAAFAERHLRIEKTVQGTATHTVVEEVEGERRLEELAAMLGGGDDALARQQARSLIAEARGLATAEEGA